MKLTTAEAIAELQKVDTLDMPARLCEAHYMSIKALEQEPSCPYYVIDEDGHGLCKNHRLEQEPKTGHWNEVFNDIEGEVRFYCSECNDYQMFTSNYCPNCGARMESEDEE